VISVADLSSGENWVKQPKNANQAEKKKQPRSDGSPVGFYITVHRAATNDVDKKKLHDPQLREQRFATQFETSSRRPGDLPRIPWEGMPTEGRLR